jgi:hypothetical protein
VVGRRSKIIKNVKLHLSQLCGSLGTYIARARARERERERERESSGEHNFECF